MSHAFPMWLRREREARGYTLRELADRCGVTFGYLSKLERGVRDGSGLPARPSEEVVRMIADGLGVSVEDALTAAGYATGSPVTMQDMETVRLLRLIGSMSDTRRRKVIDMIDAFAEAT
jgi:transcriptional regulator with XRE-family HTH domain